MNYLSNLSYEKFPRECVVKVVFFEIGDLIYEPFNSSDLINFEKPSKSFSIPLSSYCYPLVDISEKKKYIYIPRASVSKVGEFILEMVGIGVFTDITKLQIMD